MPGVAKVIDDRILVGHNIMGGSFCLQVYSNTLWDKCTGKSGKKVHFSLI